jgi:thioredoxin-like negative regulator of GroEL
MPPHALSGDSATATAALTAVPRVELNRRQQLEQRWKSTPSDLDVCMELAQIYRAENRPTDAWRILQQAIEIYPHQADLRWEYEEAILARSLLQLREVTELAHRMKSAETERELKRCQQDWALRRIEICRARLNRDASQMHLRIVLSEGLRDAGSHREAIEELEPVLARDDFSPTGYLIRGQCLLALDRPLDALASLRAAALRRSVVAPVRLRIVALRLMCDTAQRLGIALTLQRYQQLLQLAEQELIKQPAARG